MRKYKIIIFSIFIMSAAFCFIGFAIQNNKTKNHTLVQVETFPKENEYSYYIKTKSGNIVIFNKDHTIYEFTDLEPEYLPEEIVTELMHGIYFQDQEDLYEFLETYSS